MPLNKVEIFVAVQLGMDLVELDSGAFFRKYGWDKDRVRTLTDFLETELARVGRGLEANFTMIARTKETLTTILTTIVQGAKQTIVAGGDD